MEEGLTWARAALAKRVVLLLTASGPATTAFAPFTLVLTATLFALMTLTGLTLLIILSPTMMLIALSLSHRSLLSSMKSVSRSLCPFAQGIFNGNNRAMRS